MSERVGKKRATIANYLRLLKLPADIQMGLKDKKLDMGHARAILSASSAEKQLELYKRILAEGLSVRKVEELATQEKEAKPIKKAKSNVYQSQSAALSELIGRKVKVADNKIIVPFESEEDLNALIARLNK